MGSRRFLEVVRSKAAIFVTPEPGLALMWLRILAAVASRLPAERRMRLPRFEAAFRGLPGPRRLGAEAPPRASRTDSTAACLTRALRSSTKESMHERISRSKVFLGILIWGVEKSRIAAVLARESEHGKWSAND